MNTFILISACLFWFCIIFCALFIVFAQSNARIIENAREAPQSDDLTHVTDMLVSTSRLLDTYNEAAQMEFNDSVITSHDLNQIDSLL